MNLKKLKNNKSLGKNISMLANTFTNGRALVLTVPLAPIGILPNIGRVELKLTDFFDIVIVEDANALSSIPFADIILYGDDSAYSNSEMKLEAYRDYEDSLLCTNYNAITQLKKLNRSLGLSNVNYLQHDIEASELIPLVRGVKCGLSSSEPGKHLAMIMGCTEVWLDPDVSELQEMFSIREKGKVLPKNIITPNRKPYIKTH